MGNMKEEKDITPDLGRSWKKKQIYQLTITIINEGSTRARRQLLRVLVQTCFGVSLPGRGLLSLSALAPDVHMKTSVRSVDDKPIRLGMTHCLSHGHTADVHRWNGGAKSPIIY